MDTSASQPPHGMGAGTTKPLLVPELNLIPFQPGRYSVSIARRDRPPREIGGVLFPSVLAAVFPSPGRAAIDGKDAAWIIETGVPVTVEVASPGAIVVFITLRPGDFATSGLGVNVVKLGSGPATQMPPQAPAGQRTVPGFVYPPASGPLNPPGAPFGPGPAAAPVGPPCAWPPAPAAEPGAPGLTAQHLPQAEPFGLNTAPLRPAWPAGANVLSQGQNLAQSPAWPAPASAPAPLAAHDPHAARIPQARPFADPYAQKETQPSFADPYAQKDTQPPFADPYAQKGTLPSFPGSYAQKDTQPPFADPYAQKDTQPSFADPYAQKHTQPPFAPPQGAGASHALRDARPQAPGHAPGVQACGHVQSRGDLLAESGYGVGLPGSRLRLEAVAFKAEGIAPAELEYATVSHDGTLSPWTQFPYFSGSKGQNLPLTGFVARLCDEPAARFDVVYSGTFIKAGQTADFINGQFLHSNIQGDALESLWLRILPKC